MSQGCQPLLTWAISWPALLELDTPLIENTTTTISLPGTTTTSTTLVAMTADAISTLFPYQSHYWTALAIDTTVDDAFLVNQPADMGYTQKPTNNRVPSASVSESLSLLGFHSGPTMPCLMTYAHKDDSTTQQLISNNLQKITPSREPW